MGFGWLFIGYFLTFLTSLVPNIFGYIIRTVGYGFMFFGFKKLSEYNRKFIPCTYTPIALVLVALYNTKGAYLDLMLIKSPLFSEASRSAAETINVCLLFVFHLLLMLGIKSIADETGVIKNSRRAVRNFVFFCMYLLLFILMQVPGLVGEEYRGFFVGISLILQLVWTALNLIMIYSCYMKICPEGDEDMPRKRSRFKWINDFHDELDRREDKAKEEQRKYREQKMKSHAEKRKKRNKK